MSGDVRPESDQHANPPTPADVWDGRYAGDSYVYGTEPNDFLRNTVADVPPGDVLCLADGEGRNGVYLAEHGHRVSSVDLSQRGLEKAERLAAERGVKVHTIVADLGSFDLGIDRWDLIVSIFAHTPPKVRARIHAAIATALRPDGLFILESYTPDQIGRGTGGPPSAKFTMTLAELRAELTTMNIVRGEELVRPVLEGPGHTGDGAVVQVIATPSEP
ncbi:MAG: SAM-dependent methyltransferase [Acidimicrobiia bacterium]